MSSLKNYLKMRHVLADSRKTDGIMRWPVSKVAAMTGLEEDVIRDTFRVHKNHLRKYVLMYDSREDQVLWNL